MPAVALFPLLLLLASPAGQAPSAPADFDALARRAAEARDGGHTPEAVDLYRKALAVRGDWDEGWWYLSVLLYESQKCDEAEPAFARFLELKPEAGPGWVIRGVCAYDEKDHPQAIEWIQKGVDLGLGGNTELQRVAAARLAFALVKIGRFELAIQPLTLLARLSPDEPGLVEATGLALLRLPFLPSEVPPEPRAVTGSGARAAAPRAPGDEAVKLYEELRGLPGRAARAVRVYGVFLLQAATTGLAELRRADRLQPDDVIARLELAFELLLHGDNAEARAGDEGRRAAPTSRCSRPQRPRPGARRARRAGAGIRELRQADAARPERDPLHSREGVRRAGRAEDAARERSDLLGDGGAPAGGHEGRGAGHDTP
jgi:tetratricopeptide (TPR) repeat protein